MKVVSVSPCVDHRDLARCEAKKTGSGLVVLADSLVSRSDLLFIFPPEVAVDVCNAYSWVVLKSCNKVVYNNRCKNCLPCSRDAWTEQRLLACG